MDAREKSSAAAVAAFLGTEMTTPATSLVGIVGFGIPVVQKSLTNRVVTPLRQLGWLKAGTNVTKFEPPPPDQGGLTPTGEWDGLMAVHLSSSGAAAIDRLITAGAQPGDVDDPKVASILSLIADRTAKWEQGLRVLSPACRASALTSGGGGCNSVSSLSRKRKRSLPKDKPMSGNHALQPRFRFIELFSGIGGFRLALDSLQGQSVFASEIAPSARDTYRANFSDAATNTIIGGGLLFGDITEVEATDVPDHDLLTAGFPCQSFCKVGDKTGLNDHRGELFFEVVRILAAKRPKSFLLENVANLVTLDDGAALRIIREQLEAVGYHVRHRIIDASHFVPQTRLRVYIVGFLSEEHHSAFSWPTLPSNPTKVCDILESDPPDSLRLTKSQLTAVLSSHTVTRKGDLSWRTANLNGTARTLMSSYRTGYKMYSEFVPLAATSDGSNLRFYTARECARLMGFPDSFVIDAGDGEGSFYHQVFSR
ncbi:S-adenosyl-L-methionine-dependent methyltransferase [Zopfochytrium polystomum]|nr:S-adenosyl-L-methionine-dependent methyltransferase [Zopfochytrium polystomum]